MKEFTHALLHSYQISADNIRISLLSFGNNIQRNINFQDGRNIATVKESLENLAQVGGNRRLDKLLQFVNSDVFVSRQGNRANSGNVLVIFTTDKPVYQANDATSFLSLLSAKGIKVIVVGVGAGSVKTNDLELITGNPKHVIPVDVVKNLPDVFGLVEKTVADAIGII